MDNGKSNATRPVVLDSVSETQIQEMERQYEEGDHQAWGELTSSYGWSEEEAKSVWEWFGQSPEGEQGNGGGQ